MKKELKLTLSASKSESITEVAIDLYNSFASGSDISKVRIYGVDENNNEKRDIGPLWGTGRQSEGR